MTQARIPLPADDSVDDHTRALLSRRPPVHLYRMVAHAPALLAPFMSMVLANFNELSISPSIREAVILRVAAHQRSAYEIHHHRTMAQAAGLTERCIDAVLAFQPTNDFQEPGLADALLLADTLLARQPVGEALQQRLLSAYQARGFVELSLLVGFYEMVATFIGATGIELERNDVLRDWQPTA